MNDSDDPIHKRMASLSDDELRGVLTAGRDEWQPEALEVAREELIRRGVDVPESHLQVVAARPRQVVRNTLGLVILLVVIVKVLAILLRH